MNVRKTVIKTKEWRKKTRSNGDWKRYLRMSEKQNTGMENDWNIYIEAERRREMKKEKCIMNQYVWDTVCFYYCTFFTVIFGVGFMKLLTRSLRLLMHLFHTPKLIEIEKFQVRGTFVFPQYPFHCDLWSSFLTQIFFIYSLQSYSYQKITF